MTFWNNTKRKYLILGVIVLVCSTLVATFAYRTATSAKVSPTAVTIVKTPTTGITPTMQPTYPPTPTPTPLPLGPILGVESNLSTNYPNIPWVRFGYSTCIANKLTGDALRTAIANEHSQGVNVLITTCQTRGASLYNTKTLQDIAISGANAVQCGNEQMKYDPGNTSLCFASGFCQVL